MSSSTPAEVLALELCPVADLQPYHRNPRRGDVAQIARSLKRTGQYRPIVANKGTHTGRPGEVLAGNHTLAAARDRLGWAAIWTTWVDVDDDTGRVCYTMELHPSYVDTTVLRWQLRTGGTPLRNGTPRLLEG